MCRVAVEQAGYRLAFVNYLRHDEAKSVRTMAFTGHDRGTPCSAISLRCRCMRSRSTVRQMTRGREALAVVSSIVRMAKELGLQTVAEGVETVEELELLQHLGCDQAQGYLFARPVPPEHFKVDL